jgi:glycosyltransferase involved in cell wall biosynthesis
MKIAAISVFFPAFNEQKNIKKTVSEAVKVLKRIAKNWQVIVVNDGSQDKTGEIVEGLIKKELRISMITHTPNRGYGAALKSGLYSAQYPWIAFTDADGQFDFSEIDRFLANKDKADLVIGYRLRRQDPFLRILIAKLLQIWNLILFGLWVRDADCGFKLVKKEVVDKIGPLKTESAITETEFLARAKKAGFKIFEVPVHHYPRKEGKQTGGDFKVIFKAIKESLNLWKSLKFS